MRRVENYMKLFIPALSINEGLSRNAVASFVAGLNPTLDELSDIKCAVSEAVTNSIVHGYKYAQGIIYIGVKYYSDRTVIIEVTDKGCGIENVNQAMTPLFTTDTSGERSGMGFTIMQSFTDGIKVRSKPGKGTVVILEKRLNKR